MSKISVINYFISYWVFTLIQASNIDWGNEALFRSQWLIRTNTNLLYGLLLAPTNGLADHMQCPKALNPAATTTPVI